ncbi:MAG: hypothetical protein LBI70_00065, partial [Rickettsiales bacterium]|nr:hypothetical protein [Rickettsiales bacterium]
SEGKNWDYLLTSGAIVVRPLIETFEEVQQILRRVQEPMSKNRSQRGAQGFDGGFTEEKNLGILANLEDSESLKRVRFQKPGARGVASNEVYRSATKFLESLGINAGNINNIEEDYISVSVSIFTEKSAHAVTLVLDMEKIKKIAKEKGFDKIDSSNAILFKCFDSSRLVAKDPYRGILGGVARHTALVEKSILQAKGSCWWHSTIATIVTAENPKLLKGIESAPVFPDCPYVPMDIPTASGILSDDLSAALLQKHLDMSENNKVDLGTGKNLIEHIVDPIIIDSLEEFSKKEELLEEYDQKVQSLLEKYDQKVQSLGKRYSKDKSKKSAKKFKELVKEEKEKLSEEITDKKEEIKKKEEEELKELGETAKKNWKSFSEYLKNNSGKLEKFGKSLEDICEDLQHNGENIEYDPAKTKRAIDQVKTIAEKLNDEEEKKSLEDGIKKIEESNRAYVRKSLENRTQMLQQGLDNIEKLNEYTKSLGTFLENEAAGKTKNSILSIRALQVLKKAEATHEAELKNGEVDGKWKITKKNGDTIERNYKEGEVVAETVTKIHNLVAFNKVSAAASSVPSVSTPVPTPVSTPVSTAVSAPGENSTSSGLTSALRSASTSNLTGDLPLKTPSEVPYNKKTPERGEVNI